MAGFSAAVLPPWLGAPHAAPFALRMPTGGSRRCASRISACWKLVVDSASGKPYYWNTKTNETSWTIPEESAVLSDEELTDILLAADKDRFGDIANNYRPQCFEVRYFEYLTARIGAAEDPESKLALERLRARLSNPLLKNPPPYL